MKINLTALLAFSCAMREITARDCNESALESQHFDDLLQALTRISMLGEINDEQRALYQKAIDDIGIKRTKTLALVNGDVDSSSSISQVEVEAHELIHEEYVEVIKEYMLDRADIYYLSTRAGGLHLMLPDHLRTVTALLNSPLWKRTDKQEVDLDLVRKKIEEIELLNPDNYEASISMRRDIAKSEVKNIETFEKSLPIAKQMELTLLLDKSIQESGKTFQSSFRKYQNIRGRWRSELSSLGISKKYLSAINNIRDYYLHSNESFPGSLEKATAFVKGAVTLKFNNLSSLLISPAKITSEHRELFDKLNSAQKAYVVENGLCVMSPKIGVQTYIPTRVYPEKGELVTSAFMYKREGNDQSVIYIFNKEILADLSNDEIKKLRRETEKPLQERKHFPMKMAMSTSISKDRKTVSRGR